MSASIVPRRPPKKADIDRAIKSAKDAGLCVCSIKVSPDGTFEVLTTGEATAQRDSLVEWRAKRDARKASRA